MMSLMLLSVPRVGALQGRRLAAVPAHVVRASSIHARARATRAKKRPPRVMVRSEGGVPEVARCYPDRYEEMFGEKVASLEATVLDALRSGSPAAPGELPPTETFTSPPQHFRMRASFQLWREGDDIHYVMFNRDDSRTPQQVVHYPMGSLRLNELMGPLRQGLLGDE